MATGRTYFSKAHASSLEGRRVVARVNTPKVQRGTTGRVGSAIPQLFTDGDEDWVVGIRWNNDYRNAEFFSADEYYDYLVEIG